MYLVGIPSSYSAKSGSIIQNSPAWTSCLCASYASPALCATNLPATNSFGKRDVLLANSRETELWNVGTYDPDGCWNPATSSCQPGLRRCGPLLTDNQDRKGAWNRRRSRPRSFGRSDGEGTKVCDGQAYPAAFLIQRHRPGPRQGHNVFHQGILI